MRSHASRAAVAARWAAVLAIGAFYAWHGRFFVNPDGVAYLDVADTLLARGWFAAIHTHRSPLFPLLLAAANRALHVSPYWESTVAHGVAFLTYCAAFAALEFLLEQLGSGLLVPIAYALFLWGCNFAIGCGPGALGPDLLVAAAIFFAAALIVRIAEGRRGWLTYAALGATLGFGYLAKEAMLSIGALLLVTAAIAGGRRAAARLALAAALLASIACFYAVPLSLKLGRFSTGETWRYNLILWVASSGRPIHLRPVVFREPMIVAYPDAAGRGTYAVADDQRYWYEGMRPRFDPGAQLLRIRHSIGDYSEIFRLPLQFGLLVVFLALLFGSPDRVAPLRRYWFLTIPSLAVMVMYALVLVLPRYVAPSIIVLWLGLFAGLGAETLQCARPMLAAAAAAVLLALLTSRTTLSEIQTLRQPATHENWLVAERLRRAALRPGDHVAVASSPFLSYWARLAKVRIAAEVMDPPRFWTADEPTQTAAIAALHRFGIRAIVAADAPPNAHAPCFERVNGTSFLVCAPLPGGS
ncbi:MAG TPA: hypothetical protein VGJ82_16705 [Thermoanaerobaculia bacterium]